MKTTIIADCRQQDVSIFLNAPKLMNFQNGATTPKRPRIIRLRCGGVARALGDHFHPRSIWKLSVVDGAQRRPIRAASVLPELGYRLAWRTVSPQLPVHPRWRQPYRPCQARRIS